MCNWRKVYKPKWLIEILKMFKSLSAWIVLQNKNALSSVESRLFVDTIRSEEVNRARAFVIRRRGAPHIKGLGMLVVLLRGVNFGFWSHLWCSGQNAIIFSCEDLV